MTAATIARSSSGGIAESVATVPFTQWPTVAPRSTGPPPTPEPDPPGTVIDAEREQQRIRENQALGRAPTEGDTPIIRRRQRGILEGIF